MTFLSFAVTVKCPVIAHRVDAVVVDFINRKYGLTDLTYPLPQLEPILKETYGVILYQE